MCILLFQSNLTIFNVLHSIGRQSIQTLYLAAINGADNIPWYQNHFLKYVKYMIKCVKLQNTYDIIFLGNLIRRCPWLPWLLKIKFYDIDNIPTNLPYVWWNIIKCIKTRIYVWHNIFRQFDKTLSLTAVAGGRIADTAGLPSAFTD